jgi:hypothetical protein
MKVCHFQEKGWNWRTENIILKLVRIRRPKITCHLSYADYRPKTNAVILLAMGQHTKEKLCTGGIGKGKET